MSNSTLDAHKKFIEVFKKNLRIIDDREPIKDFTDIRNFPAYRLKSTVKTSGLLEDDK